MINKRDPNTDPCGVPTKIIQIPSLPLVFFLLCRKTEKEIDIFHQNHKNLIWLLVKHRL